MSARAHAGFSHYQKFIAAILAFLQFTVILDFMILSPLGAQLMSALPAPADRGAYMSISSSLQQVAGGVAAVLSGMLVVEGAGGVLVHFDRVGYVLVGTTLLTLSMMYLINRRIGAGKPQTEPALAAIAVEEAG